MAAKKLRIVRAEGPVAIARDDRRALWAKLARALTQDENGRLLAPFVASIDGVEQPDESNIVTAHNLAIRALTMLAEIDDPATPDADRRRAVRRVRQALHVLTGISEDQKLEGQQRLVMMRSAVDAAFRTMGTRPVDLDDAHDVEEFILVRARIVQLEIADRLGPCAATREENEGIIARALRAELVMRVKGRRRTPAETAERISALHDLAKLLGCGTKSDESFSVIYSRARSKTPRR